MANFGDILSSLSIGAGQSVRRNAGNTAFEAYTPSTGGGMTIGDAVSGGGANRVLYEDGSQNLAASASFTFDSNTFVAGGLRVSTADYGGYTTIMGKAAYDAFGANAHAILVNNTSGDVSFNTVAGGNLRFQVGNTGTKFELTGAGAYAGLGRASVSTLQLSLQPYQASDIGLALYKNNSQTGSMIDIRDLSNATNWVVRPDGSTGINTGTSPSAFLHVIGTTEQMRLGYDASNYFKTTVGSTGGVTFDAVGSGAGFTFSDAISFPLGGAISGGGANRVLYEDGSQNLATDADFYFTSDELYIGSARVGEWSGGGGYAVFGHKTAITSSANNYAVLQSSGGATYFNTAAGGELHFRIGNSDKFIIYDGYTAFNATADPAVAFWLEPAASNNFGLLIRGKASQSNPLFEVRDSSNATKFQIDGSYNVAINGSLTLSAQNIVTDTTTGMKIGTGTTQKLGFFNATPVVQRTDSGALTDSTGGSVTGTIGEVSATYDEAEHNANYASLTAKINALRTALRDLGLMA